MKNVKILDTTLRDGSYAINFSFTANDTATICKELEKVGIELIEIGHGVGLGGSLMGHGQAAATDLEYILAAKGALSKAKFGMFCIPGIATLENVDRACEQGMGFIRIGTDVTKIGESKEFIRKAKSYGLFVAANYMKSYALTPSEFAEQVLRSVDYGADLIYIVDSAGGMFPQDIRNYFEAIRKVCDIPIGFHGHNNLGMAVANSLEAIDMGIEYVDASLQGLGRSSGNASTELLVAALMKKGFTLPIKLLELLQLGSKYIRPLVDLKGIRFLDIIAGYADFHSSYMPKILKCADKYQVNPAYLIIESCKVDKVNFRLEVIEEIALKASKQDQMFFGEFGLREYVGGEQK